MATGCTMMVARKLPKSVHSRLVSQVETRILIFLGFEMDLLTLAYLA
jgi:hypothetical protein